MSFVVVCIEEGYEDDGFTYGKDYVVKYIIEQGSEADESYEIINDFEDSIIIYSDIFERKDTIRDEKINKILNGR